MNRHNWLLVHRCWSTLASEKKRKLDKSIQAYCGLSFIGHIILCAKAIQSELLQEFAWIHQRP